MITRYYRRVEFNCVVTTPGTHHFLPYNSTNMAE